MSGDCPATEIGDDLMTGRTDPLVALLSCWVGVFWEMELQKGLQNCYFFSQKQQVWKKVNFDEIKFRQKIGLRRRTRAEPVIELISKVVLLSLERQISFFGFSHIWKKDRNNDWFILFFPFSVILTLFSSF